jgi:hypothetical protein
VQTCLLAIAVAECHGKLNPPVSVTAIPAGRVEIESKEEAKKRGQFSPDRAEALVLACVRIVPRQHTEIFGGCYSISPV